ncbi:MAG: methyl-accepting chemotaxis protein [Clostridia bacterium]|nr:methyl-accepting chemotaxis protein [Clostridia bacterium]
MKGQIRLKLLAISFLMLAIPSLIIGVSGAGIAKNELDKIGSRGLENQVIMALQLIESLHKTVEKGGLSLDEAQEQARELLIGEKRTDGTRPINLKAGYGESDYFFVLDENGILLAHPNREGADFWEMQTDDGRYFIQEIIEKAKSGGGYTFYDWALPHDPSVVAPKVAYGKQDPYWGWIVTTSSYLQDFNRGAARIFYILLIVIGSCLLLGIPLVILFARHFSVPLAKVTERIMLVSQGVLSAEPVTVKNKDEIGLIASAVNQMESNLRVLVGKIREVAEQVAATSEDVAKATEETGNAAEEIAAVMEEISHGLDEQLRQVETTDRIIKEVTQGVLVVSESNKDIAQATEKVAGYVAEGEIKVNETIRQMDAIARVTQETAQVVNKLGEQSRQVESFLNIIKEIAEQTNLLALNAAIEAARAGTEGRGFAVVAEEVRKLADESQEAADQISDVVQDILHQTALTEEAIKQSSEEVLLGLETIGNTKEAFNSISEAISMVTGRVRGVVEASQNIETGAVKQAEAMESMAAVINETSKGMEGAVSSSEEQAAAVEEITAATNVLSRMSQDLLEAVANIKFK